MANQLTDQERWLLREVLRDEWLRIHTENGKRWGRLFHAGDAPSEPIDAALIDGLVERGYLKQYSDTGVWASYDLTTEGLQTFYCPAALRGAKE